MTTIIIGYDETIDAVTKQVTRTPVTRPLADVQRERIAALAAEVEAHIEARYTSTQQRLLAAVYARAVGKGQANKRARVEAIIDWVEAQTLYLYELAAQVQAAQDLATIEAVTFDASRFPPPEHSARVVLTTVG